MTLPRNDKEILLYLYLNNLKNLNSCVHNELTRHENTRDRELGPSLREEGLSFHVCHFTSPFPRAAIPDVLDRMKNCVIYYGMQPLVMIISLESCLYSL